MSNETEGSQTGSWKDLPEVVIDEGFPLKPRGPRWYGNTCPKCGEGSADSDKLSVYVGKSDRRWRFKCFVCGIYGDAADFLAFARNIPLHEALELMDGGKFKPAERRKAKAVTPAPEDSETDKHVATVAAILREKALDDGPRGYLKKRGITDNTIDMAMAAGQLRMLPSNPEGARRWLFKHIGQDLLVSAGMMKAGGQWPALAFKPLLAIEPGRCGFECRVAEFDYKGVKALRYGHMKWPWYFSRNSAPSRVLVTEGIIDNLSGWQIVPEVDGFLGVPGVNGWTEEWFRRIYGLRPDTEFLLGFDKNDRTDAGGMANKKLSVFLGEIGAKAVPFPPPKGDDWNECLMLSKAFL